jgi:hypothetical protein
MHELFEIVRMERRMLPGGQTWGFLATREVGHEPQTRERISDVGPDAAVGAAAVVYAVGHAR